MSSTEFEDNVVDLQAYRRQKLIMHITFFARFPKEQVKNIIKMHEFLLRVDYARRYDETDVETLDSIQEEIEVVREKFEELFEMMKDELFT
jgi:hypothetical protein